MKHITYQDDPIIHKGRVYYLRSKYGRHGSDCVLTIRTQRRGKGIKILQTKGVIIDEMSRVRMMHKLYKRFNFRFVIYAEIPQMEEKEKE
jgi:hypothetical protein